MNSITQMPLAFIQLWKLGFQNYRNVFKKILPFNLILVVLNICSLLSMSYYQQKNAINSVISVGNTIIFTTIIFISLFASVYLIALITLQGQSALENINRSLQNTSKLAWQRYGRLLWGMLLNILFFTVMGVALAFIWGFFERVPVVNIIVFVLVSLTAVFGILTLYGILNFTIFNIALDDMKVFAAIKLGWNLMKKFWFKVAAISVSLLSVVFLFDRLILFLTEFGLKMLGLVNVGIYQLVINSMLQIFTLPLFYVIFLTLFANLKICFQSNISK